MTNTAPKCRWPVNTYVNDQYRSEMQVACEYVRDMARFLESLTPQERELLIPEIYWNEVALYKRLAVELASAAEFRERIR